VLSTLPGISPRLARHLIDRLGSISALTVASVEELRSVPGIGAVRAETIHRVLTGRFATKRESAFRGIAASLRIARSR
jgi:ERCC4-type nuclease